MERCRITMGKRWKMKCEDCKYHSFIGNTHFCDSKNGKRKTVRISKEDSQKDIDCKWADREVEDE